MPNPPLPAYMYQGRHREMPGRRRAWFEQVREAMTALWWVPKVHRPTVAKAESRLLHLRTHGPAPHAFTLRTSFPPETPTPVTGEVPDDLGCSA
ncbi:hypothetical protein GCM10027073_65950 [Streptomyces chlorus]